MSRRPGFSNPAVWISTWFGSGYLKPAPGTWGTLAALPFAWLIHEAGGQMSLLIASILAYFIGIWASGRYSKLTDSHDAGEVVIDEVAGVWLALAAIPLTFASLVIGFLLFRFTDITKPFPANLADKKLSAGFGIMTDDMIAGLYAGLALYGLNYMGWVPNVF